MANNRVGYWLSDSFMPLARHVHRPSGNTEMTHHWSEQTAYCERCGARLGEWPAEEPCREGVVPFSHRRTLQIMEQDRARREKMAVTQEPT